MQQKVGCILLFETLSLDKVFLSFKLIQQQLVRERYFTWWDKLSYRIANHVRAEYFWVAGIKLQIKKR